MGKFHSSGKFKRDTVTECNSYGVKHWTVKLTICCQPVTVKLYFSLILMCSVTLTSCCTFVVSIVNRYQCFILTSNTMYKLWNDPIKTKKLFQSFLHKINGICSHFGKGKTGFMESVRWGNETKKVKNLRLDTLWGRVAISEASQTVPALQR